jgi:hypothetical protein
MGSGESDALRSSIQVPLKLTEAKPDKAKPNKAMIVATNKRIAQDYRHRGVLAMLRPNPYSALGR